MTGLDKKVTDIQKALYARFEASDLKMNEYGTKIEILGAQIAQPAEMARAAGAAPAAAAAAPTQASAAGVGHRGADSMAGGNDVWSKFAGNRLGA